MKGAKLSRAGRLESGMRARRSDVLGIGAGSIARRTRLLCKASLIALGCAAFVQPAMAQTSSSDATSGQNSPSSNTGASQGQGTDSKPAEITVVGLRGSLQRSLNIKKNATGVVDAISSEDIGKFPDANVAEAMQRIPGVSIQRDGRRGEATGITVRGFSGDFNETLFDGRRISTAIGGRSVDFSTVGSDFVGSISVLKSPDVTLSSSSIGATVNVGLPKPFDHEGLRLAATASGTFQYQKKATSVTPTAGVLLSDTLAGNTMGLLGYIIYTQQKTKTNHVFNNGWLGGAFAQCQTTPTCTSAELDPSAPRTVVGWYPIQFGAEQNQTNDRRIDGRLAYQWRHSDDLLLTLEDNYSRQNVVTKSDGFGAWFDPGAFRNIKQDANGTIVDFTNLDDVMNLNAGIDRSLLVTNQVAGNVKWQASHNLSFMLDASHARSSLNPNGQNSSDAADTGYGGTIGCDSQYHVAGDSSNSLPELLTYGPNCDKSRVIDPAVVGTHVLVRIANRNTDTVNQAKFMASWAQGDLKIDAGVSYLRDRYTLQTRHTFANNFWQAWAGYGAPSGRSSGVLVPVNIRQGTISTAEFIPGFSGNESLVPQLLVYSPLDLYAYLESLGNPQTTNIPGFNYGCCNYTGHLDLALDPSSIQDIREATLAGFMRASFKTDIAGMPFHFAAGLREEMTHISSGGVGQLPTKLTNSPADPTLLSTTFSNPVPITTKSHYSYMLPSLDMKLEITPKFHVRFDASRTLTRAPLNFLTPVLNVASLPRVGALTATGGNPRLKPYTSENLDLGFEWYYQPNSYLSAGLFRKDVTNFIVSGSSKQTINDVIDPTTGQKAIYTVSQKVNLETATVYGLELALQHVFGNTGFGVNANATLVGTDRPYDPKNLTQGLFAIPGLAKSANLVGFYDKNGLEVRVAANLRDEYLRNFGQGQDFGIYSPEPVFANRSIQIDASASYQVTRQWNVFVEGTNLTNATLSTHGRFKNQLLDVYAYGRRIVFGARFKL